jgi:tRNA A-37 threonylcarbamoyl transferase component Bud32
VNRTASRIFFPPRSDATMTGDRARAVASMRTLWVGMAIGLDLALYALLRHAPGLRHDVIQLFAIVNVGLMVIDLAITRLALALSPSWRRPALTACILCEALAANVWIQMTGTVSSYFLIIGFLLIAMYRLLCDYASGLTCALAIALFHAGSFGLEATGVLRPASLFVSAPLGIYETPLFRAAAMTTLLVGYALTFLAMNFFASMLREKEIALRDVQRDLARVVDETRSQGRLCGLVLAERYELHELIGRGGMGEVYRGHQLDDGSLVAVKVLHAYLADRGAMRERFRREAVLLERVSHGHTAKVRDCGATPDGQEWIAMEYLTGEDLATRLRRRGALPLQELLPIVEGIASALEAAHAAGIVHRDLKPENVFLLDGTDDVRLLDFGIARFQESEGLTLTLELLGTPGYMAPEQVRGMGIGPPVDVFALGAIVYRALTGKCAFPARAPAAAIYEALHLTPPRPSSVRPELPDDVDYVVTLALAKRTEDRYAHPSQLAEALRRAAEGALDEASRASARGLDQAVTLNEMRPGAPQ